MRLQSPVIQSNAHLGIVGYFEDGTQVSNQLSLSKGDCARICVGTIQKGEGLKSRTEGPLNMKFQKAQLSSRGPAPLPDSLQTCLTSPENCVSQFFVISFSLSISSRFCFSGGTQIDTVATSTLQVGRWKFLWVSGFHNITEQVSDSARIRSRTAAWSHFCYVTSSFF